MFNIISLSLWAPPNGSSIISSITFNLSKSFSVNAGIFLYPLSLSSSEKNLDSNPLQGIKNTFGSLKDELFSDDYWDDDPWDYSQRGQNRNGENSYGRRDIDPWDNDYYR